MCGVIQGSSRKGDEHLEMGMMGSEVRDQQVEQ